MNNGTPTHGKTTPDAPGGPVRLCGCGLAHDLAQRIAMQQNALGRMHMRRWEPPDDNGYIETGTNEYVPGARDFEGEE